MAKISVSQETKKELEKVIKSIEFEPRRLNMGDWGQSVDPEDPKNPPCGTKACIAGHVALVNHRLGFDEFEEAIINRDSNDSVEEYATKKLKVSYEQGQSLFYFKSWNYGMGWPTSFSKAYNKSKTAKERAKVAVARIRHFIKTGE